MIRARPYVPADREFVLGLAPRLAIGIPPWRDPHKMTVTAQGWITGSIEQQRSTMTDNQWLVFFTHCRQALETFTATVYEQEGLPSPNPEEALQIGSAQEEGEERETW